MSTDDLQNMTIGTRVKNLFDNTEGSITGKNMSSFSVQWDDGIRSNIQLYDLERVAQIQVL